MTKKLKLSTDRLNVFH